MIRLELEISKYVLYRSSRERFHVLQQKIPELLVRRRAQTRGGDDPKCPTKSSEAGPLSRFITRHTLALGPVAVPPPSLRQTKNVPNLPLYLRPPRSAPCLSSCSPWRLPARDDPLSRRDGEEAQSDFVTPQTHTHRMNDEELAGRDRFCQFADEDLHNIKEIGGFSLVRLMGTMLCYRLYK